MEKDKIMITERHVFWKYDSKSGGFFKIYKEPDSYTTDVTSKILVTHGGYKLADPDVVQIRKLLDEQVDRKSIEKLMCHKFKIKTRNTAAIIRFLRETGLCPARRGVKRVLKNVRT